MLRGRQDRRLDLPAGADGMAAMRRRGLWSVLSGSQNEEVDEGEDNTSSARHSNR